MQLTRLWLHDFRSYERLELELSTGLTALVGPNGIGKTNVVEAVAYLSTMKSFRGAPTESLIRKGCHSAVIRAEGIRDGRQVLIELQLGRGKARVQINRQRLKRARELLGALRVTVFGPDDLSLVKEGPSVRREYLDDLLLALDPTTDRLLTDVSKTLKQRAALLRSARGSLDESAATTLDVWDAKLADTGEKLTLQRQKLIKDLIDTVNKSYDNLATQSVDVGLEYQCSWNGDSLLTALSKAREHDVRRQITSVGPHRDDISITLDSLSTRNQVSQGEQRTMALALRLAGHELVTKRIGEPPLLLLDDVLSELDPQRCVRLLEHMPDGQTLLTSAAALPDETNPDRVLELPQRLEGSECGL